MGSSLLNSMGSSVEKELKSKDPDIICVTQLIKDRLYFATYKNKIPQDSKKVHYFTAKDDFTCDENTELVDRISLGSLSQFIKTLNMKLSRKKLLEKVIVNYCTGSERKRSNAVVLIGVYAITHLDMSIDEAVGKLSQHTALSPSDSLQAVQKAINLGFINFHNFNNEDFFSLYDVKLYWVIPNKFLMFSGPLEVSDGRYLSPRRYIGYFNHVRVKTIIRLCHMKYDANPFVDTSFPHYDLSFVGSVPTDKVLEVFLELAEQCEDVIVVHCREMLGRAGCLLGAYLIKLYGLTAGEALAWVRLCTSECILEVQKIWLKNNESALLKAGGKSRQKDGRAPQWVKGICGKKCIPVHSQEIQEVESEKALTSVEDVTARLENEVRVVENDIGSDNESNMKKVINKN